MIDGAIFDNAALGAFAGKPLNCCHLMLAFFAQPRL